MDLPMPDSLESAARWLVGGVLIFAFGFESVVMLWEGKFLFSACSFLIAVSLTLLLVYWAYLPTIVLVAAAILGLASIPIVFVGIVRFIRRRRVARPMLVAAALFCLAVAVIGAVAAGALFYVAKTTEAQPSSSIVVHDPPTREQIAEAAKPQIDALQAKLNTVTHERDAALKQNPPQALPPPALGVRMTLRIQEIIGGDCKAGGGTMVFGLCPNPTDFHWGVVISAPDENRQLAQLLFQLIVSSKIEAIFLRVPDASNLDAPRFPPPGEPGITLHGDNALNKRLKPAFEQCLKISTTRETLPNLKEWYIKQTPANWAPDWQIVWIEIGKGSPWTGAPLCSQ